MAGSSSGSTTSEPHRSRVSRQATKLSEEKLARKRALDREAQRSSRSKTKNHIALLESRIEALTRVQTHGNTKELVDQIEEHRKENEALRSRLKAIGKLIDTGDGGTADELYRIPENQNIPAESRHGYDETTPRQTQSEPMGMGSHHPDGHPRFPTVSSNDQAITKSTITYGMSEDQQFYIKSPDTMDVVYESAPTPATAHQCDNYMSSNISIPSLLEQPQWSNPVPYTTCDCCKMVNYTKEILGQCSKLQLRNTENQRLRDADIPIRAILHGWTAVTEKYSLDPLWAALRHADELVFSKCAAMERLVVLRNLTLMLRYRVNPTKQNLDAIPLYLHERPSQRFIPHESLIDYLVWPGLRERFVFAPHRYCSEKCTTLFWKCFRFTWAHEFEDSYSLHPQTGLYSYTKVFEEEILDLRHFCMTPEFLDEFPELRADIGCTEEKEGYLPGIPISPDVYGFDNIGESFGLGSFEELEMLGAGLQQVGGEGGQRA